MMNKINHPKSNRQGTWAACVLMLAFILLQPDKTLAQSRWTSSSLINAANAISSHQATAQSPVESQSKKGGKPDITIQSTTSGRIAKFTTTPPTIEDSVITELTNGNVGIGTTNPTQLLHLEKNQNAGTIAYIRNALPGPAAQADVRVVNDSGKLGQLGVYSSTTTAYGAASANDVHVYASSSMALMADYPTGVIKIATGGNSEKMRIDSAGNVGIGTTNPQAKLDVAGSAKVTGDLTVTGVINAKYQDLAEWVPARHAIPAGTVVVLDAEQSNHVLASTRAYDTRVAGVVSEKPGVILGESGAGKVMVATTGRIRVKVDATNAPIRVGDLLVTSDKEGIAMRSQPLDLGGTPIHRPGTLIGKALEPLEKGVGEILVLLSLQ